MTPVGQRRARKVAAREARKVVACKRNQDQIEAIEADRRQGERERWELRHKLRGLTTIRRQKVCGLQGKREDSSVTLRLSEDKKTARRRGRTAGFAGLFSCGNVWTCPHCSRKIAAARATELERVMGHYVERGGYVVLVTLTLRHNKGQRLSELWDSIAAAWAAVTKGRPWKSRVEATDLAGWVRATEVTHGFANGWHPHLHVPMIFHSRPDAEVLAEMCDYMWNRWSDTVVAMGLDAPERDNHGMDVQYLDHEAAEGKQFESLGAIAKYVSKGLALEATMGAQKEAKNGNRTTMQLLRDALTPYELTLANGQIVSTEDTTAMDLWWEYERASKRRRQLEWCRDQDFQAVRHGLNETAEQDDQELVDQELGTSEDDIAVIPSDSWTKIAFRAWDLKHAAEEHGRLGAWDWLDQAGILWYRPTKLSEQFRQHAAISIED